MLGAMGAPLQPARQVAPSPPQPYQAAPPVMPNSRPAYPQQPAYPAQGFPQPPPAATGVFPPQHAGPPPQQQLGPGQLAPPPMQQMGQMSLGPPPPGMPAAQGAPPGGGGRRVYPSYMAGQAPSTGGGMPPPMLQGQQGGAPGMPPPPPGMLPPAPLSSLGQSTPTSRIDPNQIPRPQAPADSLVFHTRINGAANMPPSASSSYIVQDTGNCSPRFMRATLNQVPCSGDLLTNSGMPLALMVQPMALMDPAEEAIQVVDFGESGPVRCSRCKGYINPFMKFIDSGRRFVCNLCGCPNDTPREYTCNLGPDGRRRDADERPELCRGSVEFVAPREYMVREPVPPAFFFLVDVSLNAVQTGAVAAACLAIKRALADLPEGERTLVGFATFDVTIHFYSLNPSLQTPTMLVVPEIQDVYTPLPSDLLVSLPQARERLESLLDSVPGMFQNNRVADSAFGAAVKGAYLAMEDTGGRVLAFQSVLPSAGLGALSTREAEGRATTKLSEKAVQKMLLPADKVLKELASELSDHFISVDLFLTTQGFVDIASLSAISRFTGGQVYHYQPFDVQVDSSKLYNDLRWNVSRPQALEGVMKVRCSAGLAVHEYTGNYHRRNPHEIYVPLMDCDKAIMVTFKHDDKLQDNSEACFQCALLYTTMAGERRVRVHTLSLPTTAILSNLFRGADLDANFSTILKQAALDVATHTLAGVRDSVVSQCVTILCTYRKYCATSSATGQLILPEALKLLPLYTLAAIKSTGLKAEATVDSRAYWLQKVAFMSAVVAVPYVYPRMFPIHQIVQEAEERPPAELLQQSVVSLSSERLDHDGVFLMENGENAFLWLARDAQPHLLADLFGAASFEELRSGPITLQQYDNSASKRLHDVLNEIRRQRCSFLRLQLLRRGDPQEHLFLQYLVEDRSQTGMSYVEFLVHVHRSIQNKMN